MSEGSRRKRRLLLAGSLLVPGIMTAGLFIFAPSSWWLVFVPVLLWGALFFRFAWLTLKDPGYYDEG